MNAKTIAVFLLLGLFPSCDETSTAERKPGKSQPGPTEVAPVDRKAEEPDIYEVAFRYLFENNASGQQQAAGAYFLNVGDGSKNTDPDDVFMRRFADVKPPVKRRSECEITELRGVTDKGSGAHGLLFRVGGLKWISDGEVEISGSYYEGNLSSAGYSYLLKKTSGKWVVDKATMGFIS